MPKPITEGLAIGQPRHEWTISEYEPVRWSKNWYITMITLGLVLVIVGLITENPLFSLIIILFGIILYLQSQQKSPQVLFMITDLGVILGNRFYPYAELENFSLIYNPPVKKLFIETHSPVRPMLRIPLLEENPVDLRNTLLEFLPENTEREEEPVSDLIARWWKLN